MIEDKKRAKTSFSFFERRVDAMLALLAKSESKLYNRELHKRTIQNYSVLSQSGNNFAENWISAIKKTLTEKGLIKEKQLDKKIQELEMILKDSQELPNTTTDFIRWENLKTEKIQKVEGHPVDSGIDITPIYKTNEFLVLEVRREKGTIDPIHAHHDHETASYLLSGKLKLNIGEGVYVAEPKDVWIHRKNISHCTEAMERSVQLSITNPPVKTW